MEESLRGGGIPNHSFRNISHWESTPGEALYCASVESLFEYQQRETHTNTKLTHKTARTAQWTNAHTFSQHTFTVCTNITTQRQSKTHTTVQASKQPTPTHESQHENAHCTRQANTHNHRNVHITVCHAVRNCKRTQKYT